MEMLNEAWVLIMKEACLFLFNLYTKIARVDSCATVINASCITGEVWNRLYKLSKRQGTSDHMKVIFFLCMLT